MTYKPRNYDELSQDNSEESPTDEYLESKDARRDRFKRRKANRDYDKRDRFDDEWE
jgi:hypothetical protein